MKHILFDLDGTLIDSAPSIFSCLALAMEQQGVKPKCELTRSLIGPPLPEIIRRVTDIDDPPLIQNITESFKECYDSHGFKKTKEYPGISEALKSLWGKQIQLYIVTNKRLLPTQRILKLMRWEGFFKGIYCSDSVTGTLANKNDLVTYALDHHQIEKQATLLIGDRLEDFQAATANGLDFFGVGWGYDTSGELKALSVNRCLESPSEIGKIFDTKSKLTTMHFSKVSPTS